MPKKSRRAKARHRAIVARAAKEGRLPQVKSMPAAVQTPPPVPPKAQELISRYEYVLPELKRIGIIAGAIILVLIILSFVLG